MENIYEDDKDWLLNPTEIKVGDVIRKMGGKTPILVNDVRGGTNGSATTILGNYIKNNTNVKIRIAGYNRLSYDICKLIEKETNKMAALYEFELNGQKTFGKFLAEDSDGNWVMETSDKTIVQIEKKLCVEVMPYTIAISSAEGGIKTHYRATKGEYSVGDLVVISTPGYMIAKVVAVDTKSKTAKEELKILKKI